MFGHLLLLCRREFLLSSAFVLFWTLFLFDTLPFMLCVCDEESEHCISFSSASPISQDDEACKLLPHLVIHSEPYESNFIFKYFVAATKIHNPTCAHSHSSNYVFEIADSTAYAVFAKFFFVFSFLVVHNPIIHFVPFFRNAATRHNRRTKMLMWANKIINRGQGKPTAIFAFVVSANVIGRVQMCIVLSTIRRSAPHAYDVTDEIIRARSYWEIKEHFWIIIPFNVEYFFVYCSRLIFMGQLDPGFFFSFLSGRERERESLCIFSHHDQCAFLGCDFGNFRTYSMLFSVLLNLNFSPVGKITFVLSILL